jgi:hypothetical protein
MSAWPTNVTTASPFAPIADYGFLSDCETCALVAPSDLPLGHKRAAGQLRTYQTERYD